MGLSINRGNVIKGLEFTKEMITFNPSTGEDIEPGNLNEADKTSYDACIGAIALLKEQESDEKNKECIEDKNAVECLNAIQTINKYIDAEEDECGCSYWKDKKGYEFKADIGYFFEGLDNFEAYLIKRLRKAVKKE